MQNMHDQIDMIMLYLKVNYYNLLVNPILLQATHLKMETFWKYTSKTCLVSNNL